MSRKALLLPYVVSITLTIYMLISYFALLLHEPYVTIAVEEDGFFEDVSFVGLSITAILFFLAFYRSRMSINKASNPPLKRMSYLFLALVFVFGAGEEISWGQRIFNIPTPEVMQEDNVQDEINIHNLKAFEGSSRIVSMESLFTAFAFTFTLLIPIAASLSKPLNRFVGRLMPLPHWGLGLLFLGNFIFARLAKILFASAYAGTALPFMQAVQEIKEGNYALLFVFVGLYITFVSLKPAQKMPTLVQ